MRLLLPILLASAGFGADVNTFAIVGYDPVNGDWGAAIVSRCFP